MIHRKTDTAKFILKPLIVPSTALSKGSTKMTTKSTSISRKCFSSQSKEKHGKTTSNQFAVFTLEILLNLYCSIFGTNTDRTPPYNRNKFNIKDLISFLKRSDNSQKALLSQVVKIAKLILLMPATNAISERSFSALKRVKTYLRSTTTDSRLNNLLVLHIHKDAVDKLDLKTIANIFIDKYDSRKNIFGQFNL